MADPLRSDRRLAWRCLVAAWALAATVAGCGSDKNAPPPATADSAPPATAAAIDAAVPAPAPAAAVTQASWAPDALEELLAPIALYPDALLAQVLAASVNSQEVLDGGNWLLQNENLQGDELDKAAEKAGFGPAMRALVQFPSVVDMMCQQIDWTKQVGSAFTSDQASVLDAVQRLRAQAKDVGSLKSTPQQTVETRTENNKVVVEVKPADPKVVYVPQYDPQVVYTTPPPATTTTTTTTTQSSGVSTGTAVAGALLAFGVGVMIGNAFDDDHCYPHWGYGAVYYGPRPFYPPAYVYRPVYGPAFRPAYHYNSPPGYRYNYNNVRVQNNINVNVNNNYFNRFENNQNLRVGSSNSPLSGTKHGVASTQRVGQGGSNWKGQSTYAGTKNSGAQARLNQAAGKSATAQQRIPERNVGGSGGTRKTPQASQHVDRGYGGSTRASSKDIAAKARPSQSATPRPTPSVAGNRPAPKDNAFSGAKSSGGGSFDRASSARGHASAGSRPHPARSAHRR